MITITVRETAEAHGITSSYQLQERISGAGYKIYPSMASKLWKNQMVTLPTLDMVADALGCNVAELYQWQPNKKTARTNGKK